MTDIPVPLDRFVPYLKEQCDSGVPLQHTIKPYLLREERAREAFARRRGEANHSVLNCFPVFNVSNGPVVTYSRRLDQEPLELREKFMFPLDDSTRRAERSLAMVPSLDAYTTNWNIFTERCLEGLNWENVVAAGSSVVVPLLPIPQRHAVSTATQRLVMNNTCVNIR